MLGFEIYVEFYEEEDERPDQLHDCFVLAGLRVNNIFYSRVVRFE